MYCVNIHSTNHISKMKKANTRLASQRENFDEPQFVSHIGGHTRVPKKRCSTCRKLVTVPLVERHARTIFSEEFQWIKLCERCRVCFICESSSHSNNNVFVVQSEYKKNEFHVAAQECVIHLICLQNLHEK